ncbi:MAG: hypothetical protein JXR37_06610 [Kiritimatiellae bacterium]|nr:hypothetical protein [Kiritimatiellia bacterium]
MIVRMKKLTLICLDADRERTLDALRALGVLHLTPAREPGGEDVDTLRAALERARQAANQLGAHRPAARANSESAPAARAPAGGAEEPIRETAALVQETRRQREQLDALLREQAAVEPFGDFSPAAVRRLAERGITVKLGHVTRRDSFAVPANVTVVTTRDYGTGRYLALIGRGEFEWPGGQPVPLPERGLAEIRAEIDGLQTALRQAEHRLAALSAALPAVRAHIRELRERLEYAEARAGMAEAGRLAWLRGFCPADAVDAVRTAAQSHGWGLLVEEPAEDDNVPTLIRSPAWVRPIKAVFELIGVLPGYKEADISAVFLLFFSVFFAILIGDAGYGALFLLLTAVARLKFKKAPRDPFVLLAILSVCTMIWGVITGTYFGIANLPAPLRGAKVDWLANETNLTSLCFLIGTIHLSVAHAWNVVRTINSTRAIAQAGWICLCWTMFFLARHLVLDMPFPGWVAWLGGAGLVAVALFMTPPREFKKEWPNHVMLPLTVVGNFVDVVSYLRLFAVGTASLSVAMAFNDMAVGRGIHSAAAGLVAAFILFFGHTLNILLGAMGILVHGVRLNTLEFSGHIGVQWAGFKYSPFAKKDEEAR